MGLGSDLCSFSMPGVDPGSGLLTDPSERECEKVDQPSRVRVNPW